MPLNPPRIESNMPMKVSRSTRVALTGEERAVTVVTLLGAVGTVLACCLPYALLLQGQPFRALWVAQLLQAPLALLLARHWWAAARPAPPNPANPANSAARQAVLDRLQRGEITAEQAAEQLRITN